MCNMYEYVEDLLLKKNSAKTEEGQDLEHAKYLYSSTESLKYNRSCICLVGVRMCSIHTLPCKIGMDLVDCVARYQISQPSGRVC